MTYRYRQVIEEGGGLTYLRQEFDLSPSQLFVLDNLIKHDHPERGCFPTQKKNCKRNRPGSSHRQSGTERAGGQEPDREGKAALHGHQGPGAARKDTPLPLCRQYFPCM